MNIKIYESNVWQQYRLTYNGKDYIIDDGSDYLLKQIHQILRKK